MLRCRITGYNEMLQPIEVSPTIGEFGKRMSKRKKEKPKMIRAEEAYQRTAIILNTGSEEELEEVMEKIEREINNGNFLLVYDNFLKPGTIKKLKKEGYRVETSNHMNECFTEISWRMEDVYK